MSNIVLVSGANQGIGSAKMPEYHVLLGSRELSKGNAAASQIQQVGGSVEAIQLDVTDRDSILAARDYIASKYNRLDVLVNAALNMLMLHYNVQYASQGWKVNACCPGFRKTNFCDYDDKAGPVDQGAWTAIKLATLGQDGETGTFVNIKGRIAW
ncbi:hypothetical protein E4T48_03986 [Aureobasidium sp. EXF-10727]|nr:hypothetical protein E4T48_03986 [Aureobasidium sp. EXF-10727]